MIVIDALQIDQNLILIKKRIKKLKKNQWYLFDDGQYDPVSEQVAIEDYYPLMIFYKRINEKNNYFAYTEYANLVSTRKKDQDEEQNETLDFIKNQLN